MCRHKDREGDDIDDIFDPRPGTVAPPNTPALQPGDLDPIGEAADRCEEDTSGEGIWAAGDLDLEVEPEPAPPIEEGKTVTVDDLINTDPRTLLQDFAVKEDRTIKQFLTWSLHGVVAKDVIEEDLTKEKVAIKAAVSCSAITKDEGRSHERQEPDQTKRDSAPDTRNDKLGSASPSSNDLEPFPSLDGGVSSTDPSSVESHIDQAAPVTDSVEVVEAHQASQVTNMDPPPQITELEKWRQARGKTIEPLGSTLPGNIPRDGNRRRSKTSNEEFEEREKISSVSKVLDDWELLTFHSLSREEVSSSAFLQVNRPS